MSTWVRTWDVEEEHFDVVSDGATDHWSFCDRDLHLHSDAGFPRRRVRAQLQILSLSLLLTECMPGDREA